MKYGVQENLLIANENNFYYLLFNKNYLTEIPSTENSLIKLTQNWENWILT